MSGSNAPEILRQQVDSVFARLPSYLVLDLVAAILLAVFTMAMIGNYATSAWIWLSAAISISVLRLAAVLGYRHLVKMRDHFSYKYWLILVSALLSGLIWGTISLIHPTLGGFEPPRGAMLIAPAIMMGSAAFSYAPVRTAFYLFVIPAGILQIVFLLNLEGSQNAQLAMGFGFVVLMSSLVCSAIHRDKLQAIKSRLLTQSLRSELARDHDRLQEKEAELLQRIHREQELLLDKQQSDDKLQIAIEEKLLLLDAVSEGILGINIDGKITFVNSAAIKLLALEESALIYEHVLDIVCRSTTKVGLEAETRKILQDCIENGTSNQGVKGIFAGGENVLLPVTFSSRPIKKGDKLIGVVLSFTDDSRQKEIESKLIQSQKMEAMGRITGGVAHDFNNLLTVIIGNLQFLRRRYFDSGKGNAGELVEKILTAAKSGAELNNRLLSFSREQSLHNEPVDLVILLGEMREFVQRILGEEISVHLRIEDSPAIAMLDRTQFENVIVNLCLNAKDAMPDGGDLIISGSHTVLTESPVLSAVNSRHSHGEKDYYELSITDTGCGIPVEIQSKVFDPFFTTKPKGEGSGFGLSTAFGFMQQSGGTIKLSSQVGKGTTFTLQLPLAKDAELEDSIRATDQAVGMYNGKVLVVEDDAAVRDVASQTLLDAGYEIIQAVDGRQGLEKFKAHPDIDLVFSDIVMPGGLTGIEMAQTIQQLRPVPVLLATGYTEKMLKDRIESQRNILCISKPYDTDELPSLINSMMTKEAS